MRFAKNPPQQGRAVPLPMWPNTTETAVDGSLIPARVILVERTRTVKATPRAWCNVFTLLQRF